MHTHGTQENIQMFPVELQQKYFYFPLGLHCLRCCFCWGAHRAKRKIDENKTLTIHTIASSLSLNNCTNYIKHCRTNGTRMIGIVFRFHSNIFNGFFSNFRTEKIEVFLS